MAKLSTLRPRISTLAPRLQLPPKRAEGFYLSPEWRALLEDIIDERGRRCEDPDCPNPARCAAGRIYGDHIVELRDGGAPLDPSNVLLRGAPCHGRKTAAARAARLAG